MKIRWIRVREGEAETFGVRDPNAGWVGKADDGSLYFAWVQARPRHERPYYAGGRVRPDGDVECYTLASSADPRPPGVTGSWLCDQGTLREAREACVEDATRRSLKPGQGPRTKVRWRCRHCQKLTSGRLPRSSGHVGDGSVIFPRRHPGVNGEPCPGNIEEADSVVVPVSASCPRQQ